MLTSYLTKRGFAAATKAPKKVVVTGGCGNISYALLFRIASGQLLGPDQLVDLHILDMPSMADSLRGVEMELHDCAFPTLNKVVPTTDPSVAYKDVDFAFLVGAKPRGPGMERQDLLKDNGKIFVETGKALNSFAKKTVKVLVVGNPANTNALIAMNNAPTIPRKNFTAMTRLDHNRALTQLALKTNSPVTSIKNLAIWGNHSPTMYPDIRNTTVGGKLATTLVNQEWIANDFIPTVQQRGAAIIKARKLSSAASAANAALDHMRDWELGTSEVVSMGVPSDGNKYGVPDNLIFSFPLTIKGGDYHAINGIKIDDAFTQDKIKKTTEELLQERDMVKDMLK